MFDPYRSSLRPKIVESTICLKDWLYGQEGDVSFYLFTLFSLYVFSFCKFGSFVDCLTNFFCLLLVFSHLQ